MYDDNDDVDKKSSILMRTFWTNHISLPSCSLKFTHQATDFNEYDITSSKYHFLNKKLRIVKIRNASMIYELYNCIKFNIYVNSSKNNLKDRKQTSKLLEIISFKYFERS